ncbi:membrane hypothetical protein [Desulfovibrionales bacterium]
MAWRLVYLALFLDIGFLAWMTISPPCFNCLLVALGLILIFFALRKPAHSNEKIVRGLLLFWLFFFSPNLFAIALETNSAWAYAWPSGGRRQNILFPYLPILPSYIILFSTQR